MHQAGGVSRLLPDGRLALVTSPGVSWEILATKKVREKICSPQPPSVQILTTSIPVHWDLSTLNHTAGGQGPIYHHLGGPPLPLPFQTATGAKHGHSGPVQLFRNLTVRGCVTIALSLRRHVNIGWLTETFRPQMAALVTAVDGHLYFSPSHIECPLCSPHS